MTVRISAALFAISVAAFGCSTPHSNETNIAQCFPGIEAKKVVGQAAYLNAQPHGEVFMLISTRCSHQALHLQLAPQDRAQFDRTIGRRMDVVLNVDAMLAAPLDGRAARLAPGARITVAEGGDANTIIERYQKEAAAQ